MGEKDYCWRWKKEQVTKSGVEQISKNQLESFQLYKKKPELS